MKSYVRNKAQLEGSIAKGYISEECLTFCSRYLDGIETRFNRIRCVNDEPNDIGHEEVSTIFTKIGRSISNGTFCVGS